VDIRGIWSFVSQWLPGRGITLVLWIGLVALTVALIILARTRWGQARPMSKCVVLSLFAHALFAAYAYGTRLFINVPEASTETSVRVSLLVVADDEQDAADTPSTAAIEPWEVPQSAAVTGPDVQQPPRSDGADSTTQSPTLPPLIEASDIVVRDPPPPETATAPPVAAADPVPGATVPAREVASAAALEILPSLVSDPPSPAESPTPATQALPRLPVEPFPDESLVQEQTPTERDAFAARAAQLANVASLLESTQARGPTREPSLDQPQATTLVNTATSRTPAPAAAPRRAVDGVELPRVYQGRVAADRTLRAAARGGDERTEAAVQAALAWLAANQAADGRWSAAQHGAGNERKVLGQDRGGAGADADTGITGLALLAFLGAGETHYDGTYRKNVQRGLEFLIRQQASTGSLAGDAQLFAHMYCHGIAFLAVSEAYAMTGDPRLKPFVERAQQFTINAQIADGGWRYKPGDAQGDMSQFGWQVMALRSAEMAGLPIPDASRRGMLRFLQTTASGEHGGKSSYRAGHRPSRTMTAEATTCRFFLELEQHAGREREASTFMIEELPGQGPVNLYYWYYGTLAMYQMNDKQWEPWNDALKRELLRLQRSDGEWAGSWDTETVWGGYGGRVYTTAMAALCLEVYYRYLPIYGAEIVGLPGATRR
jgi:hypothetical protein